MLNIKLNNNSIKINTEVCVKVNIYKYKLNDVLKWVCVKINIYNE